MDVTYSKQDTEVRHRHESPSSNEWNQQTLVDARHVLQAQASLETSPQQYQEQLSINKCSTFLFLLLSKYLFSSNSRHCF